MICFPMDFVPETSTGIWDQVTHSPGAPMKKLLCLTIFFLGMVAYPFLAHASSGPRIVIEAKEFDFKEVQEGRVVVHPFKVLNKGDQPLQIQRVNPG